MSVARTAYDASFAKLVSLVAYHDSRRSENQRFLRDLCHWMGQFVFLNYVLASLEVLRAFGNGLGTSTAK